MTVNMPSSVVEPKLDRLIDDMRFLKSHTIAFDTRLREIKVYLKPTIDEIVDQRHDIPAPCGQALLGRQAVDGTFQHEDGVHLANGFEGDRRDRGRLPFARLRDNVGKLEQLASRMRPASRLRDHPELSIRPVHHVEPGIGVGLGDPGISRRDAARDACPPDRRVEEYGSGSAPDTGGLSTIGRLKEAERSSPNAA